MAKDLWKDDNIQFTRLLAEMAGIVTITQRDMLQLCESMDLTEDEIKEIQDRAVAAFEKIKAKL